VSAADRLVEQTFFDRPVLTVARALLGCVLRSRIGDAEVRLRISEVEAYAGAADPASHAYRGQRPRNVTMFGPGGHAYVYFTYGMHFCVNLVCGPVGEPSAVLLRAGEIVQGLEVATARRSGVVARDLARGPARLTKALGIGREQDGADVCTADSDLSLYSGHPVPDPAVRTGPRVGVSSAAEVPWRYWIADDRTVSVYRPAVKRVRR
jgi:DNA-3-methyladenine glycosylase